MMQSHINLPAAWRAWNAAPQNPTMPRPSAFPFDPLQMAFRAGQEFYRAGLISLVNTSRMVKGKPPVSWPAVGATPYDVVWCDRTTRLLRYRNLAPINDAVASRPRRPPLLIVCSLINRPYVLDLLADRSVVRRFLEAGVDVWLLDWGSPSPEDAGRGIADYALGTLPRAADVVLATTGEESLHLLGYCMGGSLSLAAIAAGRLPAASLIALATPVDLHDDGLLSAWCRMPGFDAAELAELHGNVPPYLLQPAFKMLDPVGLATKFRHLEAKVGDDDFIRFFLAMETWLEDSVSFPGRAFAEWVAAYRDNAFARGTLLLDGRAIDLRRVTCPILNVVADGDYITPPASSLALGALVGSKSYEEVRLPGGHIGLSTGGAAHRGLWPKAAAWVHTHQKAPARVRADKPLEANASKRAKRRSAR